MADKSLGLGSIVKVDHDADTTFTTCALTKDFTPPSRMRKEVDTTTLEDTLEQFDAGIEEPGTLTCLQIWDPTDSNHSIIDTLFGAKTKVNWQVVTAHASPITGTFQGFVSGLSPEKVEVNGVWARTFTVRRTGAISYS